MIQFPQTVLYAKRVTLRNVIEAWDKYNQTSTYAGSILGGWTGANYNWEYRKLSNSESVIYRTVKSYYADSEIGFDDIETFVRRFNDRFSIASDKYGPLITEGALPIGSAETHTSDVQDFNTLNNGYTDDYQRNGSNSEKSNSSSDEQNMVTNLNKATGKRETQYTYGEGSTVTRKRDGKTDTRKTIRTATDTAKTSSDYDAFLSRDIVGNIIDFFRPLFMEVFDD